MQVSTSAIPATTKQGEISAAKEKKKTNRPQGERENATQAESRK